MGAGGRPFKLDLKNRFLMLFGVCYRLYITYALVRGFLFELDQSNICSRDIQKIERLVIQCIQILQKIIQYYKEVKNIREGGRVISSIFIFHRFYWTTTAKIQDMPIIKERGYSIWERRTETYCYKDTQIMVNNYTVSSFIN